MFKNTRYFNRLLAVLVAVYIVSGWGLVAAEEAADADAAETRAAETDVAETDVVETGAAATEAQRPAQVTDAERGYFYGYNFGNMLKEGGNPDVDLEMLMQGMQDSLQDTPPKLEQARQDAVVRLIRERGQEAAAKRQAEREQLGKDNLATGKAFLEENADKKGVKETKSGLQYLVLEKGSGASPEASDRVVVHYEGRLISGEVFDSSHRRGEPAEFGVLQVIKGWIEGLQLMKVGSKYRFFIPSDLAYGPGGTAGIPPSSVLVFDVELLEIKGG
ncbi:MAG: FKBP-type peptidyl-prolyl cis-trans isomerase [Pseudomonadales bacterium]